MASIIKNIDHGKFEVFTAAPVGQVNTNIFKKASKAFCNIPFRTFSLDAFRDLIEFVETHQIHFVHSHGRGAGVYSRLLYWKTKIPAVHTFHGISYGFWGVLIDRFLKRWTARFVHVSDSEKEFAVKMGVSDSARAVTIHNGIDYRYFNPTQEKTAAKSALKLKKDDFVVACVARFDSCKRHQDLIEAVSVLSADHPKLKLILAGEGETESKIKNLVAMKKISGRVLFLGEQEDVRTVYAASEVFVLPSEYEGLPLAPLEAMASGCAVILSNVRGSRDVIQDEKDGLLVEAKNPVALAFAIEKLIRSQELRARLIESAHRTVIECFSLDRMCAQIYKFYENLVPLPQFRKVALTHDWLFHMRGGEKVLQTIGELFPLAPIFTLFKDQTKLSDSLNRHQIFASCFNLIPVIRKFYRYFLPFFPFLMYQFDLRQFKLLISSSHCVAKGVRKGVGAPHVCYCHTPVRYAWGFESEYLGDYPFPLKQIAQIILGWIRRNDLQSNAGVYFFVANSQNVKNRIRKYYQRTAEVIFPPIQTSAINSGAQSGDYFLIVSACVPYKRVDLAVQAFNELKLPLVVIGSGPLLEEIKRSAQSHIRFLGWQPDSEVAKYYGGCRALIFPTDEDFGMVPLEVMMYGKPVIAFGKGGALETVVSSETKREGQAVTGIFFSEQTVKSLTDAVLKFADIEFNSDEIRRHAMGFESAVFKEKLKSFLISNVAHD